MPQETTKEEFWKIYQKLPKILQEKIFAEETADNIWSITQKNKIIEDTIPEIAKRIGHVLMGLLSPEEFQETLENELSLERKTATKITQEIGQLIFLPIKSELETLYAKGGAASLSEPESQIESKPRLKPEDVEAIPSVKKIKESDTYREPIK